jgi:hypothetical protein
MTTRRWAGWGFVFTAIAASLGGGCGITVLVPGEAIGGGGPGGQGGEGASTGTGTDTTSTTTSTPFPGCTASCTQPSNGKDTCACDLGCGSDSLVTAQCESNIDLQGNLKIKCVCTVSADFTGVCFETNPAHLCDFELGCCGKYLGK